MDKVVIYAIGITACSCCVEDELTRDQIEREVNKISPTGIGSKWTISADTNFKDGTANPSICPEHPNRLHYLMNC